MDDAQLLIDWAEAHHMALDINFMTGKVKLSKKSFTSAYEAIQWANKHSRDFGFRTPLENYQGR